ncbi:hypothetical protein [Protofrankia coriariae]|uniref:hypothetical protein n=1 Tax=Protofrankia coriariae TaxID=1562887 RepID=UPI0006403392|nr:hypothetical protein [Protofrankia coriariae]
MSTDAHLPPVADALSSARLTSYLRARDRDLAAGIELYEWNIAVSGAFHEALGIVEVVLRNALHDRLTDYHAARPGHWYDDPVGILSERARRDIGAVRAQIREMRQPETPDRVVAGLNFGFWKFPLAKRHETTLWSGHLRHAFPHMKRQRRGDVYQAVDRLHTLRNRIAHHEPVHRRDLRADTETIHRLLGWIDPDVHAWALRSSRLEAVLATRPPVRTGPKGGKGTG